MAASPSSLWAVADVTVGIRRALAMGATAAMHLLDDAFAGSDTLGTAKALAAAIKRLPHVRPGHLRHGGSDSYSGIVPVQLAHQLGIPPLTFANKSSTWRAARSPSPPERDAAMRS